MSVDQYTDWCERWINQVHDITKQRGAFWLNLGYVPVPDKGKAIPLPYLLYDKVPFFLNQEIVWNYGAGVSCKKQFSPRNEKFLWYVKEESHYTFNLDDVRDPNVKYPSQKKDGIVSVYTNVLGKLRCNPLGKNPTDVWQIPKVTSGRASKERTDHPAQFPASVIERIIKSTSNPGDLILDPFMGSGTTAEVALRLGRKVVGFEIRGDYCQIIQARLTTPKETKKKQRKRKRVDPSQNE